MRTAQRTGRGRVETETALRTGDRLPAMREKGETEAWVEVLVRDGIIAAVKRHRRRGCVQLRPQMLVLVDGGVEWPAYLDSQP